MDHHGVPDLPEYAAVDAPVIVWSFGNLGQRPARHQDDAAIERLDGFDLGLVSGDHVVERARGAWLQVIRPGAAADQGTWADLRLGEAAPDQLQRTRPVEAHAPLGRVHRLGDAEAEIP